MKLTKIETIQLEDHPNLVFVVLHTDEGQVGYADTYYMNSAVSAFIHDFVAPMLLGSDPRNIELHWRRIYEMIAHIVGKGVEMRALSAVDVALWDILGQAAGMPVWQVLGGAAREAIKTYNTCGGPHYGRPAKKDEGGYGVGTDKPHRYDDLIAFMTDAGSLAEDLLSEGITGMKIWPFDFVAHNPGTWHDWRNFKGLNDRHRRTLGGQRIDTGDLKQALQPFRQIRDAVGDKIEIMVEGHGLWSLPAAQKIARAVEPFEPFWFEDLMRADDIGALAELAASTPVPILASEYLTTRYEYKPLIDQRAADIVMIDPTWAGGITESKKIATMAETAKRPVAMHDCTGPFTYLAGIHLAINATNAVYQESVRAYLRVTYPELVTELPTVENGQILAPTAPGIGSALHPDVRKRKDAIVVESKL